MPNYTDKQELLPNKNHPQELLHNMAGRQADGLDYVAAHIIQVLYFTNNSIEKIVVRSLFTY